MDFGFTNDKTQYDAACAFRAAAIADGWDCEQRDDSLNSYTHHRKDGFIAHVLSRTGVGKWKYEAEVHVWGPDGMSVRAPVQYDWKAITAGLRHCKNCGADDVDTERYSFAGRCCAKCLPAMRAKHEHPGWCD